MDAGKKENAEQSVSIETSREELFAELKKNCKGDIVQKVIRFTNEDVPKYLKRLELIEKGSRQTRITVQ